MSLFDADRRLRVAVLFSGGASGARYLVEHDEGYGESYELVGGFTDDPTAGGIDFLEGNEIPVEVNDIHAFYEERDAETRNLEVRESFDAHTVDLLSPFDADVILLSGYMWIVTDPLIEAYQLINVHPADLTVEGDDGKRRYTGFDPVYDAIVDGQAATRSSVHFVTAGVDEGPLAVVSKPFHVHGDLTRCLLAFEADEALLSYADAHQEWMKWDGDGPAIATTLDLIAAGRLDRDGSEVSIDGEPGPFELE